MQTIYCSPYRDAEGKPRAEMKKGALKALGPDWLNKLKAEDAVIDTLNNQLDDDYYLICNALLLEDGPDADLLLFGPNGVWVFEFVHEKGSFKAAGEQWLTLNEKTADYEPVTPNPVLGARDNATSVYEYLHSKGLPVPWVNPILILTNPETTLYTESAAAASLKSDEVYQFVTQDVRSLEAIMDENDLAAVYEAFRPFLEAAAAAPAASPRPKSKAKRPLGMTTGQWIVLIGLALLNFCVLGAFAWWVINGGL